MRLLTVTTAALLLAVPLLRADDRKPPPDADAQAKSEALIKDLFKEDFAKKKPADLQALAAKLIQQAADTNNDPSGKFVLLRLAVEVASRVGDAADALQAIDAQSKEYAVNAAALKAQALEAVLKPISGATVDYQAVLDAALPAADEAQAADDYDAESKLLHTAQLAAAKVGNKQLAGVATERGKMADAIEREYAAVVPDLVTLKDKPDDADASLHVGRFLCLFKGDWDRGLPLLAVGSDAKLAGLAKKDLNGPTAAADQAALADAWMELANAETGVKSQQIELHALTWYKQAAPQLTGLDKAKAEKAMKDIEKVAEKFTAPDTPPEPDWVVLFRSADPTIWDTDTNTSKLRYAIPLSKAPDGVQFLKLRIGANRYVIIPMTNDNLKKRTDDGVFGWQGECTESWHGFHLGIYHAAVKDIVKDEICVVDAGIGKGCTGWGFGHRVARNDFQGYTWQGTPIGPSVFEISVKAGPLTDAEQKVLLTKKP